MTERTLTNSTDINQKCKDCGIDYTAKKNMYDNGDVVITPPRCAVCQTKKVLADRLTQAEKAVKGLINCKKRSSDTQRTFVRDRIFALAKSLDMAYNATSDKKVARIVIPD